MTNSEKIKAAVKEVFGIDVEAYINPAYAHMADVTARKCKFTIKSIEFVVGINESGPFAFAGELSSRRSNENLDILGHCKKIKAAVDFMNNDECNQFFMSFDEYAEREGLIF
jgi:hypothetical protein